MLFCVCKQTSQGQQNHTKKAHSQWIKIFRNSKNRGFTTVLPITIKLQAIANYKNTPLFASSDKGTKNRFKADFVIDLSTSNAKEAEASKNVVHFDSYSWTFDAN